MASTPEPINVAITVAALDLYTAFVGGGATRAMLVSLDLCNTTGAQITVRIWHRDAANTVSRYLAYDVPVPANEQVTWRGMILLSNASEKLRASASAAGVDCLGTVVENA